MELKAPKCNTGEGEGLGERSNKPLELRTKAGGDSLNEGRTVQKEDSDLSGRGWLHREPIGQ